MRIYNALLILLVVLWLGIISLQNVTADVKFPLSHTQKNRLTSDKVLILRNALPYNGFLKRKNNSEWGKIP
jgi:hypothetical protein